MQAKRDTRVDFLRGIALVSIFINHIPGNALESYTHKNFGYSDAAELFVLLAGVSAAFAYFRRFCEGPAALQACRIYQRAFTLYLAQIATLVAAAALFAFTVVRTGDPRIFQLADIGHLFDDPLHVMVGIATLGYQPAYFNILPLYIVLLAMLPGLMWLARLDVAIALGFSVGLYVAAQTFSFSLPHYPLEGPWFLNPFGWQLLFTLGFVAGTMMVRGQSIPFNPLIFAGAVLYLLFAFVCVQTGTWPEPDMLPLPRFLWDFDKGLLSLPRLLHVLALVYVIAQLLPRNWLEKFWPANALMLLGRHGLVVFCFGSLLSALGQIMQFIMDTTIIFDILFVTVGVTAQIALAGLLEWQKAGGVKERARPPVAALSARVSRL